MNLINTSRVGGPASLLACAVMSLALLGGCPERTQLPRDALSAYVKALEAGDYGRAYELMAESFKKEFDRDEFVAHHQRHPKDVKQNIGELNSGTLESELWAEFTYGGGSSIRLVREGGEWKLAMDPVTFYSQRSPREALRSFVRAMERRRHHILLRFVPNKWRKVMTVDDVKRLFSKDELSATKQLIQNLKANLENKIEVKGNEAEMLYGDSYKVQFLREDGVWKIVDAD